MSTFAPTSATDQLWGRDLLFHLAGALASVIGFTLWATGVSLSMGLAITYFGLLLAALDVQAADGNDDHRRVLAVLAFLRAG